MLRVQTADLCDGLAAAEAKQCLLREYDRSGDKRFLQDQFWRVATDDLHTELQRRWLKMPQLPAPSLPEWTNVQWLSNGTFRALHLLDDLLALRSEAVFSGSFGPTAHRPLSECRLIAPLSAGMTVICTKTHP